MATIEMHVGLKQLLGPGGYYIYEHDIATGQCTMAWGLKMGPILTLNGIVIDDGQGYSGAGGHHPGFGIWAALMAQIEQARMS